MRRLNITEDNAYIQDKKFLFYKGELTVGACIISNGIWIWKAIITDVIHADGFDIGVCDFLAVSQDGETFGQCLKN